MATLRDAIRTAKQEPTSERSMKLMTAIKSGKMDSVAANEGIDLTAFKAAVPAVPTSTPTSGPGHEAVGDAVKTGLDILNPKNLSQNLGKAAQVVGEGVKNYGANNPMTPEESAAQDELMKRVEAENRAKVDQDIQSTQALNKMGIVPPSEMTVEQKTEAVPHLQSIQAFGGNDVYGAAKQATPIVEAGQGALKGFAEGTGNVVHAGTQLLDTVNPVNVFSRLSGIGKPTNVAQDTIGKPAQDLGKAAAKKVQEVQEKAGVNTESFASKAGELAGNVAAEIPWLVAGGDLFKAAETSPQLASFIAKHPRLAAGVDFALKSVGRTAVVEGAMEGDLPTPEELAVYGAIDLVMLGLEKVGGKLYKSAFKGTKGEETALLKSQNKTVADTAQQLGYAGSAKQIKAQAVKANEKIFQELLDKADDVGNVSRGEFLKIADKMKVPFKNLPNSGIKQEIFQSIDDVVNLYAPTQSASGAELVGMIANINKDLFGAGQKAVLSPKQMASMANQLKNEIKDLLPAEVRPLYQKYAMNKTIEKVMEDTEVQRLMARSLLGSGFGATAAITSGLSTGKDPFTVAKDALLWGIAGALGFRATGNVAVKTLGGQIIKNIGKSEFPKIVTRNVVEYFKKELGESKTQK